MIFQRDISTAEFDQEIMEDLALIRKAHEEAKQYLDSVNSRLKHYCVVLQPKPKQKSKRKKQPIFEEV